MLKTTNLFYRHLALGAKMTEFCGFKMPVQYKSGAIKEHLAVRKSCGIFDVSHMAQFEVTGRKELDYLVTNDVCKLKPGMVQYTPMCKEDGSIIDDLLIYCLDEDRFIMVVNAINRAKNLDHIIRKGDLIDIKERTGDIIAVQGPDTFSKVSKILNYNFDSLKYYRFEKYSNPRMFKKKLLVSRNGYTGEQNGLEIYSNHPEDTLKIWDMLLKQNAVPCGLASRDSLRIEAGFCLYGNEIDSKTNPWDVNLSWTLKGKSDFIGKTMLQKLKDNTSHKIISFVMKDPRAIPRSGYSILNSGGAVVGKVTSGTRSPVLSKGIGIGKVYADQNGGEIGIMIRDKIYHGKISGSILEEVRNKN